ncbi:MAG: LamG domain-containing protein, partial [Bacteroidota bacterium]
MVSGQTLTLSADVPSNSDGAYFDATFEITLNQSTTGQLYLDVSEKGGVQSIEILNDYEFNSSDALPPGSDIYYNGGGTSTINSTNWLASAAKNAYSGEDLKLKIRVYPNQSGNVHLYYRAAFIFNTSEVRTPSSSAYTDQQGWFCQRSTTFNAPEVLPNVKIKNIAVNGGEDIYQGEEVQIEVTLEETNGADAGRVDVYYLVNNHEIDDSDDVSDELFANDSDKEKNPHTFLQSGQNEVKIILDIDDKIAEDDESDNEDIISVNVINVAPSTTITDGPTNGSIIEISDVTFSWSGTDPGGENVGYEVKFNDGGQSTNNTTLAFTAIEGKNTFEVRAVDNDGAYSDWVTRIFTYEEIPSSQGLIAYYPFNGNTYDESGNENHGVGNIGVAYTIDRYGKANSAASFDGAIGNVDFGNLSLAGSEISVLAWVYLENLPATFGAIVSKDEDYEILVNNEGSILFPINNQNLTAFSPTKLETGKWYLVAGTHDGNTSKIYINGQEDLSTQNSASIGNGGKFLGIGSRVFSDGRTSFFLDGKIDDVRLYNYALSSNQTDSLFQDRPTEDPNKELIAYYTFNGNTLDKSGNGNNANAYGLALTKDRFGEENKAYFFDGVDDFMSVPHNESLNLSEEFTLSTWILSSNPDTQQEILVKGSGASNHQYQMYLTNSDNWLRSSIGDISNRTS